MRAHIHVRERDRYYAVHRYLVVSVEVGVKAHQSHPPLKSREISPLIDRGYFVAPFVNGLPSLCYKRRGKAPLWGLPILSVRGIPLRFRVFFSSSSVRVSSSRLVRPTRPPFCNRFSVLIYLVEHLVSIFLLFDLISCSFSFSLSQASIRSPIPSPPLLSPRPPWSRPSTRTRVTTRQRDPRRIPTRKAGSRYALPQESTTSKGETRSA